MRPHADNKKPVHASPESSGHRPFFKTRNTALPVQLQHSLETAFHHDFSGVNIQKDSQRATELRALAFTEGETIHFAPGQLDPGSSTGRDLIGHEFAHVVQQRQGTVQPTLLTGTGTPVNNDAILERQADTLGAGAAAGRSASPSRSTALGLRSAAAAAKGNVVQAKLTSNYGEWFDDTYNLITSAGQRRGVNMTMRFKPGARVNAELIGLTQSAQAMHNGTPFYINSDLFYKGRSIKAADAITNPHTGITDEGTQIDRVKQYNNPIYPVDNMASTSLDDPSTDPGWGRNGFRFTDPVTKSLKAQDAQLIDAPVIGSVDVRKNSSQIFETAAIATKGAQAGTYYGSVQWGWQTDSAGTHTKLPFKIISEGVPSSTFLKAGQEWNATKSSSGANTVDLPIPDVKLIRNPAGVNIGLGPMYTHLPQGTRVVETPIFVSMTLTRIEVVDGPFIGETGYVQNSDLMDERP